MIKRKCDCASCRQRDADDFDKIVQNPANGTWFATADKLSLEERLAAFSMKV